MGVCSLLSMVAAIVVLVVTVHPHRAMAASGRGRFGVKSVDQGDIAVAGLCSLATITHAGYKCQEYHVSRSIFSAMFVNDSPALINRTRDQHIYKLIDTLNLCAFNTHMY